VNKKSNSKKITQPNTSVKRETTVVKLNPRKEIYKRILKRTMD